MRNDDTTEMVMRIQDFEACELGACQTWDNGELVTRVIYDGDKMAAHIMETDGISKAEAMEWVVQGVAQTYVGESSPIVMWKITPPKGVH